MTLCSIVPEELQDPPPAMIAGTPSCFPSNPQGRSYNDIYQAMDDVLFSTASAAAAPSADMASSHALLYDLSVLKEKVQQLESFAGIMISPNPTQLQESMAMVQEIIFVASSLSFSLQRVAAPNAGELPPPRNTTATSKVNNPSSSKAMECSLGGRNSLFVNSEFSFSSGNSASSLVVVDNGGTSEDQRKAAAGKSKEAVQYDVIIELDATELLAKYTHYCQVCGKGFRRDANLRMHMRAHGDEYKSTAALSNPTKSGGGRGGDQQTREGRKYSCPQEGCTWNRKHAKFQPLKSVVCVKNHYKRSHCPKIYVCKRCGLKQFSVLSDLRAHEKHCGDLRWRCSCGTNFSRKDKLMGHVALLAGHSPEPI